ncbi:MAG TPA: hypothetical protein VGC36_17710 [Rhizomicrobium sp.]
MATRMLSRTVTFRRPFVLDGFEQVEPAGIYTVDTEEESLDDVSFPVWKRNATVMHIIHGPVTEYVRIDPEDLRKAELRDAAQDEPAGAAQALLEAGRTRNNARLARRKKY